jgi:hypothetical protein
MPLESNHQENESLGERQQGKDQLCPVCKHRVHLSTCPIRKETDIKMSLFSLAVKAPVLIRSGARRALLPRPSSASILLKHEYSDEPFQPFDDLTVFEIR